MWFCSLFLIIAWKSMVSVGLTESSMWASVEFLSCSVKTIKGYKDEGMLSVGIMNKKWWINHVFHHSYVLLHLKSTSSASCCPFSYPSWKLFGFRCHIEGVVIMLWVCRDDSWTGNCEELIKNYFLPSLKIDNSKFSFWWISGQIWRNPFSRFQALPEIWFRICLV